MANDPQENSGGFWAAVFQWLKDQGPALAILIFDWKDAQKRKAEQDAKQAEFELKLEKNHEKVDSDNANVSDVDGVDKIAGPKN